MPDPTREQEPPLTWRAHLWRAALVLAVSGAAWSVVVREQWRQAPALVWVDLAVGVAATAVSFLRRRRPLGVALIVSAAGAVSVTSVGPALLTILSLAARRRTGQVVLAGIVAVAATLVLDAVEPWTDAGPLWATVLTGAVVVVVLLLLGRWIAARRAAPPTPSVARTRPDLSPTLRWRRDPATRGGVPQPAPEQYNPPLTWRGHLWRVLLAVAIAGALWGNTAHLQWRQAHWLLFLDVGTGLATLVLSFFRRRWPLTIALVTNLAATVSLTANGPGVLTSVSLATRRRLWQIVLVGLVGLGASMLFSVFQPESDDNPYWVSLSVGIAFTVAMLVWGMYLGSRRELLWTLRDRAESAEAEQGLRVARAQSDERARIAREMHDVLAHRISLISMHAGALVYRTDLSADEMRETAGLIQAKSHEALTDLRQVLGVLRGADASLDGREPPQPTFCDLGSLVQEAEQSGMRVRYDARVLDAGEMPEPVGRAAYRIVQEGLTNARKHAPGATVVVDVSGSSHDGVHIRVRNPARPLNGGSSTPGAGLGLVGLMERASLAGGHVEGRRGAGFFELDGWLPWT